ncbi:MAG: iron hydrogenase small subunit [Syntrophomonadaceae bacterium]|nr:iron hydrogenase small subunit [Syntrophomonadaceae bacterium]MDD3270976.1 iron hydrogenase small subunit [Syntrophomonadaceae bacterium]MDD3898248.1 iron hydrogenase small subunit [Syntrophomonadaceae bacterium]MDD4561981.1 iron hydrogenase small subunit [Syntrophomonadaceae bacterium]
MSIFTEKVGMTRRQFLKGSGMLAVAVIVSGVFAKIGFDAFAASDEYIAQRAAGLYTLDEKMALRKSHENPEIIQIYQEFLSPGEQKYLSEKAHHLLHTKYGKDIPSFIEELKGHSGEAA